TAGREQIILDWVFRHRVASSKTLSPGSVGEYVRLYSPPRAFIEAFNYYRAIFESGAQKRAFAAQKIERAGLPIKCAPWLGDAMHGAIGPLADKFDMLSIPDCAHFPAEETPTELATALRKHFACCV